MTLYRTCVGCLSDKSPCVARDDLRERLKGIGVTSIKWKCKDREPRFVVGDPIWALTVEGQGSDHQEGGEPYRDYFPGTVIRDCGSKLLVYIAPGSPGRDGEEYSFAPSGNGFCKITLSRISKRDGERETICKACELPASKGHQNGYSCTFSGDLEVARDTAPKRDQFLGEEIW